MIPHIERYFFREVSTPPKWCDTPPLALSFTQAHPCDTPFGNKKNNRPNRQTLSKNCPKIVFSAPPDNLWTFQTFSDIFDTFRTFFVNIPFFWAVQRLACYNAWGFLVLDFSVFQGQTPRDLVKTPCSTRSPFFAIHPVLLCFSRVFAWFERVKNPWCFGWFSLVFT